jgi:hypothetical protein
MATAAVGRRTSRAVPAPLRLLAKVIRNVVFVISGVPVQLAGLAVLAAPWLVPRFIPVSFWQVLAAVVLSVGLALLVRVPLTFIERHRCWSVLGVDIPPPTATPISSLPRRITHSLRSEATWRQLGYHLLIGPLMAAGGLLTLGMLAGGAELAGTHGWALLPKLASAPKGTVISTCIGVVLWLLAPVVAGLVTWLDRMAATALLGASRAIELEQRVETLSQSRTVMSTVS